MKLEKPNPTGTGGAGSDLLGGASLHPDSPFTNHRKACLAVLNSGVTLNRREGQFLGGEACNEVPMSEKQTAWLAKLLDRAGLPPLATGGQDD
jgi:hypothetical protein